jgi:hypothetical protein
LWLQDTCHHFTAPIPAVALNTRHSFTAAESSEAATGSGRIKRVELWELWVVNKKRGDMGDGTLFGKPEARERKTTAATHVGERKVGAIIRQLYLDEQPTIQRVSKRRFQQPCERRPTP